MGRSCPKFGQRRQGAGKGGCEISCLRHCRGSGQFLRCSGKSWGGRRQGYFRDCCGHRRRRALGSRALRRLVFAPHPVQSFGLRLPDGSHFCGAAHVPAHHCDQSGVWPEWRGHDQSSHPVPVHDKAVRGSGGRFGGGPPGGSGAGQRPHR